jgi:hypothetical protein
MHIKNLCVRNFRALDEIEVEFHSGLNVIVGPNAIGKTTILEAIRLAKAMLAARTQAEGQQTLISLGAIAPHRPQQLIDTSMVGQVGRPLEIVCSYTLTNEDVAKIQDSVDLIVTSIVRSRFSGNVDPATFASFLSSSNGSTALQGTKQEVSDAIIKLKKEGNICRMHLIIDFMAGRVHSPEPVSASFVGFLDSSLPPGKTLFSYFPADRALPRGEQPIQIGSQDAQQLLESHNGQPHVKYGRLKNTIFNAIISNEDGRDKLDADFRKIFNGILKGKELVGASVNDWGMLSTTIKDVESGKVFDIDAMSSGEKGVILTFLLIAQTVNRDGLVLLDEPELHLNPAVCKEIIPFMIDNYIKPNNLQMIICSHSPEILAGAFSREDCYLFHLLSGRKLSRIGRRDEDQIHDALRRLGTSEVEGLLYRATMFVEGEHDAEILERGFGVALKNVKVKDLGGRSEIEKQIKHIQQAEAGGAKVSKIYFIFDKDNSPTDLSNSSNVKIHQWDRRCIENYLIDFDVLEAVLRDGNIVGRPANSAGDISEFVKTAAMSHIDDYVIQSVYNSLNYENPGLRRSDISGRSIREAAVSLFKRLERVGDQMEGVKKIDWITEFEQQCEARKTDERRVWEAKWQELCDGKRLIQQIHEKYGARMSLLQFKVRIIENMAISQSPNWRAVDGLLRALIQ